MITPHKDNHCSKYAPKMLSIKITGQCNRRCAFCIDSGGYNPHVVDVECIAEKANEFADYQTVIITGGEPFLVFEEVLGLLHHLRSTKSRIVLNTNGTLLTAACIQQLNGWIDELQISVHHFSGRKNAQILCNSADVLDGYSFIHMRNALQYAHFKVVINSVFSSAYSLEEMPTAVHDMTHVAKYIGASKIRFTELKKVDGEQFVSAAQFLPEGDIFTRLSSDDLITKGCMGYYTINGIEVTVRRLCDYSKGEKSTAAGFVSSEGRKHIDMGTSSTFKVIYSDGAVMDDWIFQPTKTKQLKSKSE